MSERAVIFIDGSNWYHSIKEAQVERQGQLDYVKIAQKLVGPRTWQGTRYYVGQLPQSGNARAYAEQRSFLARFQNADRRHSVHLGRLETRPIKSDAAQELLQYLGALSVRIDPDVFRDLQAIGDRHRFAQTMVEKAVDVMLAVDLVVMAVRNEFDTAYVFSADGDFTHAVSVARNQGKKVFAVSARRGAQLAAAVNKFIRVDATWFAGCYS
jgi:uncharacterized LabA/DUF88 family protein